MDRILGIDFGYARVGLAISDPLGFTARGLETIHWNGKTEEIVLKRLEEIVKEYQIETIVLGLPKRTDNKKGDTEIAVEAFAERLEDRVGVKPYLRDERLTTVMAHQILRDSSVKKQNRRNVVDQIAAEIILQSFLEEKRRGIVK